MNLELNIKNSINTDTISEDFKSFSDTTAPLLVNTGIERNGGVTNIYELQEDYPTLGEYIETQDNKTISITNSATADYKTISVEGSVVGQVSAYGIEKSTIFSDANDAFITSTGYVTCNLSDNIITVSSYDFDSLLLESRDINFTGIASVLSLFTSLSFVKFNGQTYASSQEFCLRLGDQVVILQESNPTITISQSLQSTNVLGTSDIYTSCVYNGTLVVAGANGRIGSFDGSSWKNFDGTGNGIGIYNSGDDTLGVVGSQNIVSSYLYTYNNVTYLVFGSSNGRIGCYNGSSWTIFSSVSGIANNGTVVSTDHISCFAQCGDYLIVGSLLGKIGSWNGTAWTLYSNATAGAVCDNNTLLVGAINAMLPYTDTEGNTTVVVAGAGGKMGSFKIQGGAAWNFVTTTAPAGIWYSVAYGNGVWVAISLTTSTTAGIARSTDNGLTWNFVTTTAPAGNWISVSYGNGVWVAVSQTNSTTAGIARSTDNGLTWNFVTTTAPGAAWISVAYGNGVWVAISLTNSTTAGIARSVDDGLTWNFITTTAPGTAWYSVAYGNGVWVAVSQTNSTTAGIARSTDGGLTWSFVTTTAPGTAWFSVAYGNGVWVAISLTNSTTAGIARSVDNGLTWNFITTTAPAGNWRSVAYGNGVWVAVAATASTTAGIARSVDDGLTWSFVTTTAPGTAWVSVAYGNGVWVALAYTTSTTAGIARSSIINYINKHIYTTASTALFPTNNATVIGANPINKLLQKTVSNVVDVNTWNFVTTPTPGAPWISVAYGNGVWVAVSHTTSTTAGIARSTDGGLTWNFVTTTAPSAVWISVAYGNGVWVAVAYTNSTTAGIARSTDGGLTWSFVTTTAPAGNWYSVAYGNGVWVAVSQTNSTTAGIARSTDGGLTWNFVTTTAPAGNWRSVSYGNGVWVAVVYTNSTTAGIARSTDNGLTWNFVTTTAPAGAWISVAYGNGVWVAVVYTNSTTAGIARSVDNGLTWNFVTTTAPAGAWKSVSYGNGVWVAVSQTASTTAGIARSVDDGLTWSFVTTTAPGAAWYSVAYGNGVWVAVSLTTSTTAGIARATLAEKNVLIIAGGTTVSLIGSFLSNNTWVNYNSTIPDNIQGYQYKDNGTLLNVPITSIVEFGDYVVFGGDTKLASISSVTGAKSIYTSGLPISNNATVVGSNIIYSLTVFNNLLIVSAAKSVLNSVSILNAFSSFYSDGSTSIVNLLEGFDSLGYINTYRYENGIYLINLVGNSLNKSYTLNNSTKFVCILTASYCLPQIFNGLTRHICTASNTIERPLFNGSNIKASGLVGFTDFNTFSNVVVYPTITAVVSGINKSAAGFGYSDFTYKLTSSATSVFNYVNQFQKNTTSLYQTYQSNANILVNAYGKLNNNLGVPSTKPFEFRVGMIDGVQSFLSVALLDNITTDTLGVLITNVGDFDPVYQIQILDDNKILYKNNLGSFVVTKIGTSTINQLQKIDINAYKLNSISPLNIVETDTNILSIGSCDFNNRMLFNSTVGSSTSTLISSFINSKYSNSIDTGNKLVTITSPTSSNIQTIGTRIPVISTQIGSYTVDTYVNNLYSFSTTNSGYKLIVQDKVNLIYAENSYLPVSIGNTYENGTIPTNGITIFLRPGFDSYSIGNDIDGVFTVFQLLGQTYLFDRKNIYLASLDSVTGVFNSKTIVATATGLKYISSAPNEIYFLSSFDNSIYIFTGGRSLNKFKRCNNLPKINSGIFSCIDNTLVLDTDTSFIWSRDSIITENLKAVDQTNLKYYNTESGIVIGNNVSTWKYSFTPVVNSTVVPLVLQTSYFGFNLNNKSILSNWVITIYNEYKTTVSLKGTSYVINENIEREQIVNWVINPVDYNDSGYCRLRLQPQNQRSLGTSLKLETDSKILIVSILPEFVEGESAVIEKSRSR